MLCTTCRGTCFEEQKKRRNVDVERGMPHMQKLMFENEGHQLRDGQFGSLYVIILQLQHPLFQRRHANLYMRDLEINLTEALCGYAHCFEHLDGRKKVIRTLPGEVLRHNHIKLMRGAGMPVFNKPTDFGDLYVQFKVNFPPNNFATPAQLATLESLLPARQQVQIPAGVEPVQMTDFNPEAHRRRHETDEEDDEQSPHFEGVQCQTA